jgi:hypothetical protein
MIRVLLLTLRAQLVDMPDDARSYRYWQSPSNRQDVPIRSIKFPAKLRGIESCNQETREYLKYVDLEDLVNICFCPAIEAIAAEPYQKKLTSLLEECNRYRYRLAEINRRETQWCNLPIWERVWYALRRVPFTELPEFCQFRQ